MKSINLRDIPDDLHKRIAVWAAQNGFKYVKHAMLYAINKAMENGNAEKEATCVVVEKQR